MRDRQSDLQLGNGSLRAIDDMGFKEFHTFVVEGGGLDSRLEQVLAWIEGEALPGRFSREFGATQPARHHRPAADLHMRSASASDVR